MERDRGDNVVCTFGTESNPSMLVARAMHGLVGCPTTFAERERARLVTMYGDPTLRPLFVSADTTFDMICDDLVENGWHLYDAVPNWDAENADVWSGTNTFYQIQFLSPYGDIRCLVPLHADTVAAFVANMESSGSWLYAGSKVL